MTRVPPWLVSMFAGLLGAALLGALGAPSLVALLGGVAVGLVAHRSRRDPPWTAGGRRRWREGWRSTRGRLSDAGRWWRGRSRQGGGPFGGAFRDPARSPPVDGWPGGPGSTWSDTAAARPEPSPEREPRGGSVTVRCELVTDRLQVWHSTETGRAYEVPRERGLLDAAPGDLGTLTFEGGRPRVVTRSVN